MLSGYSEDLAYIHCIGFEDFIKDASTGIGNIMAQNSIHNGVVVDLGAGSGFFAAELTKKGYDVIGIDISSSMIDIAKSRVPKATFYTTSFLDFIFPTTDVVTSLSEVFNYLFDENNNLETLQKLFKRIYTALKSGGILIFDILEHSFINNIDDTFLQSKEINGVDWKTVVRKEVDKHNYKLYRYISSTRLINGNLRKTEEVHAVQLFNEAEIKRILEQIGFRVTVLKGYGIKAFENGHVGFLAKKI